MRKSDERPPGALMNNNNMSGGAHAHGRERRGALPSLCVCVSQVHIRTIPSSVSCALSNRQLQAQGQSRQSSVDRGLELGAREVAAILAVRGIGVVTLLCHSLASSSKPLMVSPLVNSLASWLAASLVGTSSPVTRHFPFVPRLPRCTVRMLMAIHVPIRSVVYGSPDPSSIVRPSVRRKTLPRVCT